MKYSVLMVGPSQSVVVVLAPVRRLSTTKCSVVASEKQDWHRFSSLKNYINPRTLAMCKCG